MGSGVEVVIGESARGDRRFVYLFEQDGSLDPGAGQHYVNYQFELLSGPYLTKYNLLGGPNPENTAVTTNTYSRHFADRWLTDELHLLAGGATGVDILDHNR